jgi:hypothetical protein
MREEHPLSRRVLSYKSPRVGDPESADIPRWPNPAPGMLSRPIGYEDGQSVEQCVRSKGKESPPVCSEPRLLPAALKTTHISCIHTQSLQLNSNPSILFTAVN